MIRLATPEDFEPWVGRKVRLNTAPRQVELVLAQVRRMAPIIGADFRQPFELLFEAPWHVLLQDDSYECDCGRGGPYVIHMSQLRPADKVRRYQAIFA